jgi:hypothetical protein
MMRRCHQFFLYLRRQITSDLREATFTICFEGETCFPLKSVGALLFVVPTSTL